jgi:uncharacterized protein YgiM (DUF1202 family)
VAIAGPLLTHNFGAGFEQFHSGGDRARTSFTMTNRLAFRLRNALCSAFGVSLVACAGGTSPATLTPVAVVDTVVVRAAADAELEQRVATLQLQLLERTAQVDDVQRQLEAARQEVVRQMAQLQTLASRANAASAMAEAEIGVEALTAAEGDQEVPEAAQAKHFLELSTTEFADENYAGALYLASQARSVARAAEFRLTNVEQGDRQPSEVLFALPVPLETVRRSNVRTGPGLRFRVLVTLDPATPLVGRSHTELWVRITDDQEREGWIFHNLVGSPPGGGR